MNKENDFRHLLENYVSGVPQPEHQKLLELLEKEEYRKQLEEILKEEWENRAHEGDYPPQVLASIERNLLNRINAQAGEAKIVALTARKRKLWLRISVAASVAILLAIGAAFLTKKETPADSNPIARNAGSGDVPPGGEKAILTLANGQQIVLDTAANGALASQGGIKVIKIGGQLSYDEVAKTGEVLYNTITTPRGGEYQVELADGSKAWLNAASSLRFPAAFTGKSRVVELTGEGYFEVAHNPDMPFQVKVNNLYVTVLGTHFNINSYADEPQVRTTLLEGRLMVNNETGHVILNPGQQANASGAQLRIEYDVDVNKVMAWKNGYFSFDNAPVETVMRELSRWYDIDVIYEGDNNETFSGKIDRKLSLKDLLDGLGQAKVHYRIENGKKLVILP
ncbi:FecR family protein [Flavihumibacter petaseus]|uniref:Putative anti-sigma factor n=1 Tax=Flavihumibacter petaseus NBRC 106054 TaxID=1220578 RepID=A0A0E9MZQ3_9BACT|nr:FecR family protein [Flavihumibacter petaseus]GAO43013.1 putative anti-sigma factor [Flavihumibacter petaseus NBRC 106054]